jgi:dienelactone hydrolase
LSEGADFPKWAAPRSLRTLAAVLLAFACSTPADATQRTMLSASVGGETIPVYFYKPDRGGSFPLLVMSHGSPRDPSDRGNFGANTLSAQASAYAAQGVAVAVPIRRGYGDGGGAWAEGYGRCSSPDYYSAGLASAEDIQAAINVAAAQPGVDRSRIALIGVSAGAWASVAAGTRVHALGIISFAGGRGSRGPDNGCDEDALVRAAGSYGSASHTPELWVYSINDHFFGPALAKRMYDAFTASGGNAQFVAAPAFGADGHKYFSNVSAWKPMVDSFLRRIGFFR